jgi:hypothetical protein
MRRTEANWEFLPPGLRSESSRLASSAFSNLPFSPRSGSLPIR